MPVSFAARLRDFSRKGSVSHRVTLGDMASQRSVRFPDELVVAVELEARRRDRSFSYVVVEAVRVAMESASPGSATPSPTPAQDLLTATELQGLANIAEASLTSQARPLVQRGSVSPSLKRFGGST